MKNKNIFALSPALILENFKMYWYLPVLTLIVYFFGGIFPIITNYDKLYTISNLIADNFRNLSLVFIPLLLFVPLIASCIAMSFYHSESRALALHAQPYSKSRLFNSQVVSGWLMCILPLLVMSLLYLCFMKEVTPDLTSSSLPYSYSDDYTNVYTTSAIFGWLGNSIVIMTFFFGMFVLAGALVGTTVMQVLLSGVMFGILPLMIFIINAFCDSFLLGYDGMSDFMERLMTDFIPLIRIVCGWGSATSWKLNLAYLAAGIVMLILAGFAYGKAKLEKVGDSMIFKIIEEIITYLIVFVGMAAFGWIFYNMAANTKGVLVLGMVVGTLITFFVVKIIIAKSIKVFNKQNLASLCVFAVIAVLFTGFTVYDLSGFANRLPDENKIQSVELSGAATFRTSYDEYYYDESVLKDTQKPVASTDPAAISAMYELEKYIVENRLYVYEIVTYDIAEYAREGDVIEYGSERISFRYKMKNGTSFKRTYFVRIDDTIVDLLDKVVATDDWKSHFTLADKLDLSGFDSAMLSLNSYRTDQTDEFVINRKQVENLISAKDADLSSRSYFESLKVLNHLDGYSGEYDVNITLSVLNKDFKRKCGESVYESQSINFTVMSSDKNTLACLREIGVI